MTRLEDEVNSSNKTAIVTGASRGIGAAVAERLAADGFAVVVNYAGSEAAATALTRKIEDKGGRALSAQADVSDPGAVRRLFDTAETTFGGVDVLVNNAGIMMLKSIGESDDALFDRQIAVNLKGTFNGLREAARRLRKGGRIVNFSTSVVGLKLENYGVYAATKAAIETMTAILRQGIARPFDYRQRHRARADGDRSVPRWKIARGGRTDGQAESAGTPRHAAGYRCGRGFPCWTGRILDQRPDTTRQWRSCADASRLRCQYKGSPVILPCRRCTCETLSQPSPYPRIKSGAGSPLPLAGEVVA